MDAIKFKEQIQKTHPTERKAIFKELFELYGSDSDFIDAAYNDKWFLDSVEHDNESMWYLIHHDKFLDYLKTALDESGEYENARILKEYESYVARKEEKEDAKQKRNENTSQNN